MSDYADNLRKSMIHKTRMFMRMVQELKEEDDAALREQVIRMAREAGLLPLLDEDCFQTMGTKNFGATKKVLERFFLLAAAAGAAAEREACAQIIQSYMDSEHIDDPGWNVARDILNDIQGKKK